MSVKFSTLAVGDKLRLENCYGEKVAEAVEEASEFYNSHNCKFHGWNFRYQFMAHGEWNYISLSPDTLVEKR